MSEVDIKALIVIVWFLIWAGLFVATAAGILKPEPGTAQEAAINDVLKWGGVLASLITGMWLQQKAEDRLIGRERT